MNDERIQQDLTDGEAALVEAVLLRTTLQRMKTADLRAGKLPGTGVMPHAPEPHL